MGEEADSVLASTHISAEDRKKYDAVVGKFDAYFKDETLFLKGPSLTAGLSERASPLSIMLPNSMN